jgi:predicted component of type VI protein secretion system
MVVRLVIEQGRRRRVFAIREPGGVLGRARGCAIRIPSPEISRRHCRVRLEDGLVYVEDLDSVNGTRLNGEFVSEKTLARPGDRLEVGPVAFVIEYELTPEALNRLREELGCEVLEAADDIPEVARAEDEEDIPTLEPVAEVGEPLELDFSLAEEPWEKAEVEDIPDVLSGMEGEGPADEDYPPRRGR